MMIACAPRHALRCVSLVLLLGLVAPTGTSRGALMKYEYGGTITQADPATGVAVGTRFTGTFAYDPQEPSPNVSLVPEVGTYLYGQAHAQAQADSDGLTATIGGKPTFSQVGGLMVENAQDSYSTSSSGADLTTIRLSSWNFQDSHAPTAQLDFVNRDHLIYPILQPPSHLNLSDFTSASLQIWEPGSNSTVKTLYAGTIDTLTPLPTPEPATWLLLTLGAGGWLVRTRSARPGRPRA